jgi:hypothetical protein
MKLKLDENLGHAVQILFEGHGHDAASVSDQSMTSASDGTLIEACKREGRCLVTLDLDFGNPLLFKPSEYAGIAVIRLPRKPSHADLVTAAHTFLRGLARQEIQGKLWVVQRDRIREYQEPEID